MSHTSGDDTAQAQALERLTALVARLRAPDGCPWDQKQTPLSACAHLLEEAYEVVEAVEMGDAGQVRSELGDLLFQAVFMTQIYAEEGSFTLAQAMDQVEDKMRRRHPHVFGTDKAYSADDVRELWGRIKETERREAGERPEGLLDSLPKAAPALVRANRLGQRAARVRFDWEDAPQVWDKVREELGELASAQDLDQQERELGDLLFALAQWARHRGINPESALRRANNRFQARFAHMEKSARRSGQGLDTLSPAQWDRLWEEAKAALEGDSD
jgi:MazG family protein